MTEELPSTTSFRQPKLFHLEDPLTTRFGTAFFRALPQSPGVYFFHDADGRLLYIGQSSNLRARLGSYRHVSLDRHPRRTRRLVAAVARIEWQICASPEAAVELESRLLLERRPPFNRAGVWRGEPWWLRITDVESGIEVVLRHTPAPGDLGPLPSGFRHTLSLILRAAFRVARPDWGLADFPCGLMRSVLHREFRVPAAQPHGLRELLTRILISGPTELLTEFDRLPLGRTEAERDFWLEERDRLTKLRPLALSSWALSAPDAEPTGAVA